MDDIDTTRKTSEFGKSSVANDSVCFAGLNVEESREYRRILALGVGELSQEELDYFRFLNKRTIGELLDHSS